MDILLTILLLLIAILGVVFAGYILCKNTVNKSSPLLASLRQLNKKYHFHDLKPEYTYSTRLQSKAKYDRFNLNNLFEEYLCSHYNYWKSIQQMLQENQTWFQAYTNECDNLIANTFKSNPSLIPNVIWKHLEMQIFKKEKLSPVIYSQIVCCALYSSPQGRNNYSKSYPYPFSIITSHYSEIQRKQHLKQSVKYQHKKERNKLSPSLRFKILNRDHNRCQICGRSAHDGVKLHVDHIKPIAKGGLTIESNLRTLCEECNWGKSDKY